MKRQTINQTIHIVKSILRDEQRILFCYIFGSTVRGDALGKSDVDIAVYLDNAQKQSRFFDIRLELIEKITRALHQEIDVVILNTSSPFLRYVVIKEGKLVFEHDPKKRIDFELKVLNEYFDYKPILKQYQNSLRVSV